MEEILYEIFDIKVVLFTSTVLVIKKKNVTGIVTNKSL